MQLTISQEKREIQDLGKRNATLIVILILCLTFALCESGRAELADGYIFLSPADAVGQANEGGRSEQNRSLDKSDSPKDPKAVQPGVKEFLKDTAIHFGFISAGRLFYVRNKESRIFDTSFSQWIDNITEAPVWNDEDGFVTNFVYHPLFGAEYYLFYRARGHGVLASALGSVVQSTLFEYALEGLVETPSGKDLVFTPGVGVPLGYAMENISEWLIERDNSVAKAAAYIVNPTRIFIRDSKFGIVNPVAGTFAFQSPFSITPSREKALRLSYPFFNESPIPIGRLVGNFEVVDLEKRAGGQLIFYSVRVDFPSRNNRYSIYLKIPYSGVNNVNLGGEEISNGFEFSNILIGGKYSLLDSQSFSVAGGLEIAPPTAFKDNVDRLRTIVRLPFGRDLPLYLTNAATVTPYISSAIERGQLSLIGSLGLDLIFSAESLERDAFEARIKYGAAFGTGTSLPASPTLFAELNGYTFLSDRKIGRTDLFLTPGLRLGKKYGPGFGIQIPVTGPTASVTNASFIFDFQGRF